MKKTVFAVAVLVLASLCRLAQAGLLSPDPTGLWYDPDESGWGLSLSQQGDTIFAVLFVYDSVGRPQWYVASSVQEIDDRFGLPGGPKVGGTLYRTSGPWFGAAFDPHAVTAASVGTIQMYYDSATADVMSVVYTIDGTGVEKTVRRQTWRDTRQELQGHYQGRLVIDGANSLTGSATPPPCPSLPVAGPTPSFSVTTGTSAGDIHLVWGTGTDTVCSIDGSYRQGGQLGSVAGTLNCGPLDATLFSASVNAYAIHHDNWGMTAGLFIISGTCAYTAHMGGVRVP